MRGGAALGVDGVQQVEAFAGFIDGGADARKAVADPRTINGEIGVWLILIVTGLISILMTFAGRLSPFAPIVYATLPVSIGVFVSLWRWGEAESHA